MRVLRRRDDDFLLLTEPELGETLRDQLVRMRFAAKAEIELEEHTSTLVFGGGVDGIPNEDYGEPAVEALDVDLEPTLDEDALDALRIEAGTPRFGKEIDDRVLPAEAGLVERAVSLTKGCYPGQEPIARLHYRGHSNRGLRVLAVEGDEPAGPDAELSFEEKVVGPGDECRSGERRHRRARLRAHRGAAGCGARAWSVESPAATLTDVPAPVAQGIERCPAEAEVARSNRAGRTSPCA